MMDFYDQPRKVKKTIIELHDCDMCDGVGRFYDEFVPCPHALNFNGHYICSNTCPVCRGAGEVKYTGDCPRCKGTGKREISVTQYEEPTRWT